MVVVIDGRNLGVDDVVVVARSHEGVRISEVAKGKIRKSHELIEKFVSDNKCVYGVTTGFGALAGKFISKEDVGKLSRNIILSHSTGVGEPFPEEIVRATLLVRINALAKGNSGVRLIVLNTLVDMLNKSVVPVVPEKGSVGSSGDLAPLSHIMLTLIGEGEAFYKGKRMSSKKAMGLAGIKPVVLSCKEGLALTNGTSVMTAIASLAVYDSSNLMKSADAVMSLTAEAVKAVSGAFDERIHQVRPHKGQGVSAGIIRSMFKGSKLIDSDEKKIQDSYTIRCTPQVHGASRDSIAYVKSVVEKELNSATDNPLLFPNDGVVISGGNFHGQPIALVMDFLGIAVSELGSISERRIAKLVDPNHNNGLPPFLIGSKDMGLNSGFMIPQYTAAALVSENKILSHPASVDSIPTSANQEDHVSMGTIAARKILQILDNSQTVLGIELLNAAQAIDFRGRDNLGAGTKKLYDLVRKHVNFMKDDDVMYEYVNPCVKLVKDNKVVEELKEFF